MIQRIQSIWLLAAAVCSFLTLKFDFYYGGTVTGQPSSLNSQTTIFLTVLASGIGLAAFISIFLYKQRKLQLRILIFTFIASALLLTLLFLQLKKFTAGAITLTSVIYFVIPIFLLLAVRGIWKDEKLIKSTDKLR